MTLLSFCFSTFGQNDENMIVSYKFKFKNSVEAELFGHGLFYSVNYERLIINGEKFKTLGQIGVAYYPKSTGLIPIWMPIMINQLFSIKKHHIEIGIGQIIYNDELPDGKDDYELFGGFKIGYRFQNPNGRLLLKIAFTPIIGYWDKLERISRNIEFHPLGGLTFGYSF